jgi:long-chain acyl-CoA synthetase
MTDRSPLASLPCDISQVLLPWLRQSPDAEVLVTPRARLSYRMLDEEVERHAAALYAVEIVVLFHAVARLGAIWVGINALLAVAERRFIIEDSGSTLFLSEPRHAEQIREQQVPGLQVIDVVVGGEGSEWHQRVKASEGTRPEIELLPTDPAGISYTSGTTGFPKGVLHSHHNLLVAGAMQNYTRGYGPSLRKLETLSSTILNVMAASNLMVCQAGGTLLFTESYDVRSVADLIRAERVTVHTAVAPVLYRLLADETITKDDLSSLVDLTTGGGPLPEVLHNGIASRFGIHVVGTYGLTEAPAMLTMDGVRGLDHVTGGSGTPMPHVSMFAVDSEDQRLPAGEIGEICVAPVASGPWQDVYTLMLGYWMRPELSAEVLRGQALHTGDIGYLDEQGRLFIVDRKSALIIRGGANVYPAEVERVLAAHPAVADCAVLGVPDEQLGERVVAIVELAAGVAAFDEADARTFCAGELARYKVPEHVFVTDAFPRNTMLKIIRPELPALLERLKSEQHEGSAGDPS